MLFSRLLLCLSLFLISVSVQAAEPPDLHRGLNIAAWLANAPRQPLYARDFAQIKQAGFDHVRLPFNPNYYDFTMSPGGGTAAQIDFTALDRAVMMAEQYQLPVIIDIHPGEEFMDAVERHGWAENQFIELWQTIAEHYKTHASSEVIFELLNEPQYYHTEDLWNKLAARSIAAIRAVSPDRTIIVGAPHGSEIDGLPFIQTSNDPNVIYAFHFYEPYLITHQGIHMGFEGKAIRYARNLPYPSSLAVESATLYAPNDPDPAEAQKEISAYIAAPWDEKHIDDRIGIAKAWADKHHVKLICGEYGALRNHIDAESRYRWIHDARAAMDADHIGWELWDYSDLFGIAKPMGETSTDPVDGSVRLVNPEKGSRQFEPAALRALGMTK